MHKYKIMTFCDENMASTILLTSKTINVLVINYLEHISFVSQCQCADSISRIKHVKWLVHFSFTS